MTKYPLFQNLFPDHQPGFGNGTNNRRGCSGTLVLEEAQTCLETSVSASYSVKNAILQPQGGKLQDYEAAAVNQRFMSSNKSNKFFFFGPATRAELAWNRMFPRRLPVKLQDARRFAKLKTGFSTADSGWRSIP
jgi:hypothetical protein